MEKIPSDYLEKKLERKDALSRDDFLRLVRLIKPISAIEYKKEDDIKIKNGDLEINFSYRTPADKDLGLLKKLADGDLEMIKLMRGKIREIRGFVLKNEGNKFDLFDLDFLENYKIYFGERHKESVIDPGPNHASTSVKYILMFGDMLSPSTIISLFHELGHVAVDHKRSDLKGERKRSSVVRGLARKSEENRLEEALREERNAWAFALRNIRPFLKNLGVDREDLEVLVHKYSLGSYSELIRWEMEKFLEKEVGEAGIIEKEIEGNI